MGRQRLLLGLILLLTAIAIGVITQFPTRLGLDLQGGAQLTLQVKTTEAVPEITPEKLEGVKTVVENRVNALGVSESVVQTAGTDQLIVQLPGVQDPSEAERILGETAQLDFRQQKADTEAQLGVELQVRQELLIQQQLLRNAPPDEAAIAENKAALERSNLAIQNLFEKTELSGDKLKTAYARPLPGGQSWEVGLEFNNQGAVEFANLTKNIAGTGRSIGIFLDNALLSAPTVQAQYAETGITGGNAVITGNFDAERASQLAVQLQGGALPVPVEIVENRSVGATLGRDSIQQSIYAGIAGIVLVLIFMLVYYRLPGLVADISLVIYAILTFGAFKLLDILFGAGFTLTLPGIAGLILSVGMAVDANVLIFERTREELRAGKSLYRSIESGFYRAFSSILDSNVTTLISCAALIWLGTGLVKGFAITLAIGVVVSMFTAITCSRTLLMYMYSFPGLRKPQYFCPNLPPANKS